MTRSIHPLSGVTLLMLWICALPGRAQVQVQRPATLMGSLFDITVTAPDSAAANAEIDRAIAEIDRIENLISEWRPETQIAQVNSQAGIRPVKVDREVFELTKRAIGYSAATGGAFDVSIAAMDKLWRFDGSMTALPDSAAVRQSIANVGYGHIVLDSVQCTIFLARKGMKIGFGSIGKGYAADKGRELLRARGVAAGIVNASGDLSTWMDSPRGKPWVIGIRNPMKPGRMLKALKMRTGAVATSGSYEKFAEIGGTRYAHIINPRTGYPSTGLTSVTITGPSAEFANFLSTSIMVLGVCEGLDLMQRFSEYRYLLLTDSGKVIKSKLP